MPILGRISVEESLLRVMKLFLLAFSSDYHVNTVINSISTNHKQKFSAFFLNGKKKCDSLLFLGRDFTRNGQKPKNIKYHWNKKKTKN